MFQEAINNYLQSHGYNTINLKAVLFDMDGVLFNSMPNHAESWHKVMLRFGFASTASDLTPSSDSLSLRLQVS